MTFDTAIRVLAVVEAFRVLPPIAIVVYGVWRHLKRTRRRP